MADNFGVLQRIGRSFMLPIAVLPIAGVFLGFGASFSSPQLVDAYNLTWLAEGMPLNYFFRLLKELGGIVFANLPLIFAVGVAIGFANVNKETAALAAVLGFLIFHVVIHDVLSWKDITPETTTVEHFVEKGLAKIDAPETTVKYLEAARLVKIDAEGKHALYDNPLGIFSLQTGVLGGMICGVLAAVLTNKFSFIVLPPMFSFFNGTRFIPIVTLLTFPLLASTFPLFWPYVFGGMIKLGKMFADPDTGSTETVHTLSGEIRGGFTSFLYGAVMRMVNVTGLHHAIYPLFWYTPLGGTATIQGEFVEGGQRIFFAQLADPLTKHFSREATKTMTGSFFPMGYGLPAAALAMYHCATPENRSKVKGLYLSAGLTSFLTGITEPIEFTFLFVAFPLYVIHAILEGLGYAIAYLLNISIGITFSRGFIDFTFFGIMQGNAKTNYFLVPLIGSLYAVVYYFLFKYLILKFNWMTPGRGGTENKLYTRSDYKKTKNQSGSSQDQGTEEIIVKIVEALGGRDNIAGIDACITRLRVTVKSQDLVKDKDYWMTQLGAQGVVIRGTGVQVVYGAEAENYKNLIRQKYGF